MNKSISIKIHLIGYQFRLLSGQVVIVSHNVLVIFFDPILGFYGSIKRSLNLSHRGLYE